VRKDRGRSEFVVGRNAGGERMVQLHAVAAVGAREDARRSANASPNSGSRPGAIVAGRARASCPAGYQGPDVGGVDRGTLLAEEREAGGSVAGLVGQSEVGPVRPE
jgi:hypothetical protein